MVGKVTEVAIRLNRRNAAGRKIPAVILMTDAKRLPDPYTVIPELPRGSMVIIRAHSNKEKERLILKNKRLCNKYKVLLSVSDAPELAHKHRLDGLHIPEQKRLTAPNLLHKRRFQITSSCHSFKSLRQAEKLGIRTLLLSPLFPTQSHPGARVIGFVNAQRWIKGSHLSFYALGGISKRTVSRLKQSNFVGLAGIEFAHK